MNINMDITIQEDVDISFDNEPIVNYDFGLDAAYTGTYEATPRVDEQTLNVANKTMIKDVVIKPIPVTKVVSPNNKGYVVTIG